MLKIKTLNNRFIKIILVSLAIIALQQNNIYASISKWNAYPEWGYVLKISIVALYISIVFAILGIVFKLVLNKANKEMNIINKLIHFTVIMSFGTTLVGRIFVDLNIYNNTLIYFYIGVIICFIIFLLTKNSKFMTSWKFYAIVLVILIILLVTNANGYPYEVKHYTFDPLYPI